LDLLVAWALYSNANLQVASDLAEILTLRVKQGDPLVLDGVLRLEVHGRHVELVGADHFISEHAFIHDFDADGLHLNLAGVLHIRGEKAV